MKTSNMKEYQKNWFSVKKEDPNFVAKRHLQFGEWYTENKDNRKAYQKEYQEQNRDAINAKRRLKNKERLQNDPKYKLRLYVSNAINRHLLKMGSGKGGLSCLDSLPYSMEELKSHIESQFEPWMNWNNRGKYNSKTWDDNDATTWTWQLDHTVPHSTFQYKSMNDIEFFQCWSLSNLQPISAKSNILKGSK